MDIGILAYGGYIPQARLQRSAVFAAHSWFNPGLKSLSKGERAAANWDEDAVTMAVEAARDCLTGLKRTDIGAAFMASTSFPFRDRQNVGIVADALNLPEALLTLDVSSSQRAGTSGLAAALQFAGGTDAPVLFTASEKRRTKAASPQEMTYGDGAAALLLGKGDVIARFLGSHTVAADFVDHFRGEDTAYDYAWEERWIRDEGYLKLVPQAVKALLEKTGTAPQEIAAFCFPAAMKRAAGMLAEKLEIREDAIAPNLQDTVGETGAAHPIVMLAQALESARPGDKILVTGFGQGCDALLFEVTPAITALPPRAGISGALTRRRAEDNYQRFLAFNGLVERDEGIRAEVDKQTGLSTHYRNKDRTQKMLGGKCTVCGASQFPKARLCVTPECGAMDSQVDYPFADRKGRINSFTADRLTYTPDPPAWYGMVQFEGGGRLMCDFTDIPPGHDLTVGTEMRMMFRVKDYDTKRGFRRYFWKAALAETPGASKEG